MKTLKTLFLGIGALAATLTFNSCLDDDDYSLDKYWVGIATVKPLSSDSYYLQLDDSTTLLPVDGRVPYFGLDKERRAMVNFTLLSDSAYGYNHAIRVNDIDSILTKSIVPSLGAKNDSIYGKDAIDLDSKGLWIGDGYITFQFKTYFGGMKKHYLNLVQMDETKPYELEFRHNAYDDPKSSIGWGLVSFRLNTLPNTEGKTVKLKIKYTSYDGEKTYELDYNSSKPNSGKAPSFTSKDFQTLK